MTQPELFESPTIAEPEPDAPENPREDSFAYMRRLNRQIHEGSARWNRWAVSRGESPRHCPCAECRPFQKKKLFVIENHWGKAWHLFWLYEDDWAVPDFFNTGETFLPGVQPCFFYSIESALCFAAIRGHVAEVHCSIFGTISRSGDEGASPVPAQIHQSNPQP
jgi:hypothetical protein